METRQHAAANDDSMGSLKCASASSSSASINAPLVACHADPHLQHQSSPFSGFCWSMTWRSSAWYYPGPLGDLFGRRRLHLGFLIFVVSSAFCGLAQIGQPIILFRVFQGIGGAMILANGRAVVSINSLPSERGKALGLTSMAYHVGYLTGPTLGGFIIDTIGWRWIFFVTIPIGLAAAYFAWRVLKEREKSEERVQVDFTGASYLLLTNICFVYALNQMPHLGFGHPVVFSFFIVSLASLALFIRTEQRVATRRS